MARRLRGREGAGSRPLRVLLSTRPEPDGLPAATAGALALAAHALLALGLAVAGPLGGSWRPSVPRPLKAELPTPAGMRERARHDQASWTDLQRAAARGETRTIIDDRIKAIRAQRARARADSVAAHHR